MQVGEHVAQLPGDLHDPALGQGAALGGKLLFEVGAFDKIHHQIMTVALTEPVKDGGNCRVLELGKGVGLAVKILNRPRPLFGVGEPIENLFDGAAPVGQTLVLGDVHEPHASTGQKALDAIAPGKNGAGLELATLITGHGRGPRYS